MGQGGLSLLFVQNLILRTKNVSSNFGWLGVVSAFCSKFHTECNKPKFQLWSLRDFLCLLYGIWYWVQKTKGPSLAAGWVVSAFCSAFNSESKNLRSNFCQWGVVSTFCSEFDNESKKLKFQIWLVRGIISSFFRIWYQAQKTYVPTLAGGGGLSPLFFRIWYWVKNKPKFQFWPVRGVSGFFFQNLILSPKKT